MIKKEAAVWKAEIGDGLRPEAAARDNTTAASAKKPRTPNKEGESRRIYYQTFAYA